MGKVAIITGSARGIGASIAEQLAEDGYDICVNYRASKTAAENVVSNIKNLGRRAVLFKADVSVEQDVLAMFEFAEQKLGPIDCLVNNAGVTGGFATVCTVTGDQIDAVLSVNVKGTILCCREAALRMKGRGGVIANISSTVARTGGSGEWVHYAASKAAVTAFTNGFAKEVADQNIRVVTIAPGLIETDLHADNGAPDRPQRLANSVPMRRVGLPEEVARGVVWLLSDNASYVTGSLLEISGGR